MRIFILGISGKEAVGKDTIADYIAYDYLRARKPVATVFRFQFARLLKRTIATLYQVDENYFDNRDLKENKIIQVGDEMYSPRELMLYYGEAIRNKHSDFFIQAFIKELQKHIDDSISHGEDDDIIAIISDVRFKNELDFIHSRNGHVMCVCTPTIDPPDLHLSCDSYFENEMKGMYDLHVAIDKFLDEINFF